MDDKKQFLIDDVDFQTNGYAYPEKPLDVEEFLRELRDVFVKHDVYQINEGVTGWQDNGQFGIVKTVVRLEGKDNR